MERAYRCHSMYSLKVLTDTTALLKAHQTYNIMTILYLGMLDIHGWKLVYMARNTRGYLGLASRFNYTLFPDGSCAPRSSRLAGSIC